MLVLSGQFQETIRIPEEIFLVKCGWRRKLQFSQSREPFQTTARAVLPGRSIPKKKLIFRR